MTGQDIDVVQLTLLLPILCFRQHFYLMCSFSHMKWTKLSIYLNVGSKFGVVCI